MISIYVNNTTSNIKVNNNKEKAFGNISVPLSSCPDVAVSAPTSAQQLTHNSTLSQWTDTTPATMTTSLSALTDCSISDPVDNDFLKYDSTSDKWVNQGVTVDTSFASMTDTNINTPSNNQALIYNSTASWENETIDHTVNVANVGTNTHA